MNVLIALDKFKGSIGAADACAALRQGMLESNSSLQIVSHPIADGGDGTLAVLEAYIDAERVYVETMDPLGRAIRTWYLKKGQTAFIELAHSSGISLLEEGEYDIMHCHTLGTGKIILHALNNDCQDIVLGLGGSCTNDIGLGILHELGYRFLDATKKEIIPCGANLLHIARIELPYEPKTFKLRLLNDVENVLFGMNGAAAVYGPQKGATNAQIVLLDKAAMHVADLIHRITNKKVENLVGGGAAGGIPAGLYSLLNAEMQSGFQFIMDISNLKQAISESDLILTGEGRVDEQSFQGKVVGEIVSMARNIEKRVILVSGKNELSKAFLDEKGVSQSFKILDIEPQKHLAMKFAYKYLKEIGMDVAGSLV